MTPGGMVRMIRSRNAGPSWVAVDVICGDAAAYTRVSADLSTEAAAALYDQPVRMLKRFDIPDLDTVKFRPVVQGSAADHDTHGAQRAHLLVEMTVA